VRSTEYWPRADDSGVPDMRFEQLRGAYFDRLQGDRAQLAAIRLELGEMPGSKATAIEHLRQLAHRMCGAAAIFEAGDIFMAAEILERAATDAARTPGAGSPAVHTALDTLLNQLSLVGATCRSR